MSEEQKPNTEAETAETAETPSPQKEGGMGMYLVAGLGALIVAGAVAFALGDGGAKHGAESAEESAAVEGETHEASGEAESDTHAESEDGIDDLSFLNTEELEKAAEEAASELAREMSHKSESSGHSTQGTSHTSQTSESHSSGAESASSAEADKTDSLAAVDWLEKEKKRLAKWEKDLKSKAKKLEAREREVNKKLKQIDQAKASRLTALAKLYDSMKQDQVARMLVKLDDETIVSILPRMKTANASKVLGLLPPDRGARISRKMITLSNK